ncbi:unnamed protein product [Pieris macdunnoughi]|uniref:Uncharacterized protein n=1 Tax=Pieris macdunnoughi TaxID=345717 RepID=A0A821WS84_9NEOP|nr:unnamed protein product [Pieris macdunnoughi]
MLIKSVLNRVAGLFLVLPVQLSGILVPLEYMGQPVEANPETNSAPEVQVPSWRKTVQFDNAAMIRSGTG